METEPYSGNVVTVPGSLRGYREWRFISSHRFKEKRLNSVTSALSDDYVWNSTAMNIASCGRGRLHLNASRFTGWEDWLIVGTPVVELTTLPSPDCTCGFYAKYDCSMVREYVHYESLPGCIVMGSIRASGRMVLGTKGFRAERAMVESLAGAGVKKFAKSHNIPWYPSIEELQIYFPPEDVSSLIGDQVAM